VNCKANISGDLGVLAIPDLLFSRFRCKKVCITLSSKGSNSNETNIWNDRVDVRFIRAGTRRRKPGRNPDVRLQNDGE
jgi:hypothetical protein